MTERERFLTSIFASNFIIGPVLAIASIYYSYNGGSPVWFDALAGTFIVMMVVIGAILLYLPRTRDWTISLVRGCLEAMNEPHGD
ncbi:hypothetical protein MUP77_09860 [Candidatus Bathyarchaeota archaeon]|nr:hypothetical protein [Candidatus Bathyarchaeota archaeon]